MKHHAHYRDADLIEAARVVLTIIASAIIAVACIILSGGIN